jgi:UDP:flavonoid glycosyltransferase YjiC (YdhE family)
VHHGGIGTTARALEAGVPQVILPQRFDQPDNGARCEVLGVGSVLEPARATALTLSRAIHGLLGNAGVARWAAELRGRIEASQGVERLADTLEASGSAPAQRGNAAGAASRRACEEAAIAG